MVKMLSSTKYNIYCYRSKTVHLLNDTKSKNKYNKIVTTVKKNIYCYYRKTDYLLNVKKF